VTGRCGSSPTRSVPAREVQAWGFSRKPLSEAGLTRRAEIDQEVAELEAQIADIETSANRSWQELHHLEQVRKTGNKRAVFSAPSKYDAELERRIRDASYGGLSYQKRLDMDIESAASLAAEAQADVEQVKGRVSALRKERRALR
jgi:hypothetical protein